jgi:hypothetical protein
VPAAPCTVSLCVKGAWFALLLAKQEFVHVKTKTKSMISSTKKKRSASKVLAEYICKWQMSSLGLVRLCETLQQRPMTKAERD